MLANSVEKRNVKKLRREELSLRHCVSRRTRSMQQSFVPKRQPIEERQTSYKNTIIRALSTVIRKFYSATTFKLQLALLVLAIHPVCQKLCRSGISARWVEQSIHI